MNSRKFFFRYGDSRYALYGDSPIVLPAHLLSWGLGSNVSIWLIPPTRKIQMTLFALGSKSGLPPGGSQTFWSAARTMPSSANILPRTNPVKPMPISARKDRRFVHLRRCEIGL